MIRTSDDSGAAKERLITVFELSDAQATYILDMQLRRLTRFSKIELEKEQEQLRREIEELDAILGDEALLKKVVSDELAEVAKTHGTPRRTVLLGAAIATTSQAPTEVADDPCLVFLSSSGLLARTESAEEVGDGGDRTNHDVVVSTVATTARGEIGVVTNLGRLLKLSVLDLTAATIPPSANHPNLNGTLALSELLSLDPGERALALTSLATDGPGLALGTKDGVVKRVNPEVLARDEWDVIGLKDGDEVVGAVQLDTGTEELCFITTDAQLLHFGADGVRPQGRSGGGMQGIRLTAHEHVAWFGAVDPADAVVVTASGSATALPGTEPGAVKVTPFSEYPPKGRATGGVRCHRFLKGEDTLVFAWVGDAPARGAAASGAPDRPARGQRPTRRVRHPGVAVDRRGRRAGGRSRCAPCARLTACRGGCRRSSSSGRWP